MPTIKIADKPTLDQVAGEVHELWERTPFDIDSYMYYFGGLRSMHPGDDVYNWLMRTVSIVDAPGVTELGEYALYNCANLTSLSIPDCEEIKTKALTGCSLLSTLNADKLQRIPASSLDLTSLRKLILPSIESFDMQGGSGSILEYAFFGKIKTVSASLFYEAKRLKYMMFGELERITGRFMNTYYLTYPNLILINREMCSLSDAAHVQNFVGIYVPASVYDDYIVATNWSSIADKIHKIEDSQEILDAIAEMGVEYGA